MGTKTGIGWTDHTHNEWIGCTVAGPGCDFCYARDLDARYQWGVKREDRTPGVAPHWGIGAPRYLTSKNNRWRPHEWNAAAESAGRPAKVFCNSLSDVFDNEVQQEWREGLFRTWRATPWLRWQVVTKRVPNIAKMLPADWGPNGYPNVGFVATVCDQTEFDRDAPRLLRIPAAWHGFSIEPQLGEIILPGWLLTHPGSLWFITGGESRQGLTSAAAGAERPYDPCWAFTLTHAARWARDAGREWRVFVKQMGCKPVGLPTPRDGMGKDPVDWPAPLRVQEFVPELHR